MSSGPKLSVNDITGAKTLANLRFRQPESNARRHGQKSRNKLKNPDESAAILIIDAPGSENTELVGSLVPMAIMAVRFSRQLRL